MPTSKPKNFKLKWTAFLHEPTGRDGYTAKKRSGTLVVKPDGKVNYQVVFSPKGNEYTGSQVLGTCKGAANAIRLAEATAP